MRLTPATIRVWFGIHSWTSLICTVFLLMLCVTGLPLIFHHEIDHALGVIDELEVLPAETPLLAIDRVAEISRSHAPGKVVQFMGRDADEPARWFVALGDSPTTPPADNVHLAIDGRNGKLLGTDERESALMKIVFQLHVDLFAGLPGKLFLGGMGALFLAAIVSGAVLYAPFMRERPFGTLRLKRTARIRWYDLHNVLGMVVGAWALVVGATGVINTLDELALYHWKDTELAEMASPYAGMPPAKVLGSIDVAVAAALAGEPGMRASFIAFPQTLFSTGNHYTIYLAGSTPLTSHLLTPALIDAETLAMTDRREMPWYLKGLFLSKPLHFGDYGGLPMKIIWALMDALTIVVLISGVVLWVARRRIPVEVRLADLLAEARP